MKITKQMVLTNQHFHDKKLAIQAVAQILTAHGKIQANYLDSLLQRELVADTYLGKGIAIPHGMLEHRHLINETAIAILQVPQGVVWNENGDKAHLIIAITAKGDEHLQILRHLTQLMCNSELLETLSTTNDANIICQVLNGENIDLDQIKKSATQALLPYHKDIVFTNPQGMHARPATTLVSLVKSLNAKVILQTDSGQQADASKMFEVLGLGLAQNSNIRVLSDNNEALQRVIREIALGLGDDLSQPQPQADVTHQFLWQPQQPLTSIQGVGASTGLVMGKVKQHKATDFDIPTAVGTHLEECKLLDSAIEKAKNTILSLMEEDSLGADQLAILEVHLTILEDADMIKDTIKEIRTGKNAIMAYKTVSDKRIEELSAVNNSHIAQRASDIRDVRNHVLKAMLNIEDVSTDFDTQVILFAEDLTPSDTMKLSPNTVLGFVTAGGGPTAHSAIVARNMGIPAVVAGGEKVTQIADGTEVILDGLSGIVYLNPSEEDKISAQQAQQGLHEQHLQALKYRKEKGQTQDGKFIEISANINEAENVAKAVEQGAEGVGLMRSEFLYLSNDHIPTEDEQYEKYSAMAEALGDKPLIIRTLDIGGDKEVDYLGLVKEDNAFLGVRGIRLCLERKDLFIPQLRAICRASLIHNNIHIMFPMVSKLSDWLRAKELFETIRQDVGSPIIPTGIMVEVPSVALMADELAKHVDFFSIGTNDLTQYTLAMDRMHPVLASQTDAMHPAVLRLIKMTVEAGNAHNKWVGVCGSTAGEIDSAKILVGLGVTELSMSPTQIADIKYNLRQYSLSELQELAKQALVQDSATAVRELLQQHKQNKEGQ